MITTTANYLNNILQPSRQIHAKIIVNGTSYTNLDKLQTLMVDEKIYSEDNFQIGGALSSYFEAELINTPAITNLQDQVAYVLFGVKTGTGIEWVQKGAFVIETVEPSQDKTLKITGFDFMVKLEVQYVPSITLAGATIDALVNDLLAGSGITKLTTTYPNSTLVMPAAPDFSNMTKRQVLAHVSQVCGCYAKMDYTGKLTIKGYTNTMRNITQAMTTDLQKRDSWFNTISKLIVTNEGLADVVSGTGSNILIIEDNPIFKVVRTQAAVDALYNNIKTLSFKPMLLTYQGDPSFESADLITVTDYNGTTGALIGSHKIMYDGAMSGEISGLCPSDNTRLIQTPGTLDNTVSNLRRIENLMVQNFNAVNATISNLNAQNIKAGKLQSVDGKTYFDLDNSKVVCSEDYTGTGGAILEVTLADGSIATDYKVPSSNLHNTLFMDGDGIILSKKDPSNGDIDIRTANLDFDGFSMETKSAVPTDPFYKLLIGKSYGNIQGLVFLKQDNIVQNPAYDIQSWVDVGSYSSGVTIGPNLNLAGNLYASFTGTSFAAIKFGYQDANGAYMGMGAGGLTIVGSGESTQNDYDDVISKGWNNGTEQMVVASDNHVYIHSGCQTIANKKEWVFQAGGNTFCPAGGTFYTDAIGKVTAGNAGVTINNHMVPLTTGTNDLGTSTIKMRTIYATTTTINSDVREKENVQDLSNRQDIVDFFRRMRFVKYDYIDHSNDGSLKQNLQNVLGFIAQEAIEIDPIIADHFIDIGEDENKMLGVNTYAFAALQGVVIQEQQRKIDKLENDINELKGLVNSLLNK